MKRAANLCRSVERRACSAMERQNQLRACRSIERHTFSAVNACRSVGRHAKPDLQNQLKIHVVLWINMHCHLKTERNPKTAGQRVVLHYLATSLASCAISPPRWATANKTFQNKNKRYRCRRFFLDIGSSFEYSSQNGELFAAIEKRDSHSTTTDGSINDATRDGAGLYLRISFVRMQLALIRILSQKFRTRDGAGFYRRTF